MKKRVVFYFSIFCLLIGLLSAIIYLRSSSKKTSSVLPFKKTSNLTALGPYGVNVKITTKIGDLIICLKANRLYFQKTKIFVFKSALLKKLVAEKLMISVFKKGKKFLIIKKDKQILSPNLKRISILQPQIIFPANLKNPDKIVIDTKNPQITVYYGKKKYHFLN